MWLLKQIANNTAQNSYATKMRRKRFNFFCQLLQTIPKPVRILDIGGTQIFWEMMGFSDTSGVHITLLNLHPIVISRENFSSIVGNATELSGIQDDQFDVVFSNSVIEHLGDAIRQKQMAQEVQRVGKRYFVQTPNYFFPLEPHFLFPGFQWLPISVRVFLIRHFNLGWIKRISDQNEARELVKSIRLLRKHEFLALFPEAKLYEEKLFGMTKSFIVYNGWEK